MDIPAILLEEVRRRCVCLGDVGWGFHKRQEPHITSGADTGMCFQYLMRDINLQCSQHSSSSDFSEEKSRGPAKHMAPTQVSVGGLRQSPGTCTSQLRAILGIGTFGEAVL